MAGYRTCVKAEAGSSRALTWHRRDAAGFKRRCTWVVKMGVTRMINRNCKDNVQRDLCADWQQSRDVARASAEPRRRRLTAISPEPHTSRALYCIYNDTSDGGHVRVLLLAEASRSHAEAAAKHEGEGQPEGSAGNHTNCVIRFRVDDGASSSRCVAIDMCPCSGAF